MSAKRATTNPHVRVVGHLPRYGWTARALWEAGLLDRHVRLPVATHADHPLGRVPGIRTDAGLDGVPGTTLWATAAVTSMATCSKPMVVSSGD